MVVTKIRLYRESGSNRLMQEMIYGQDGLSQNNACTNEILVVLDGFELASGELLRIAYEEKESARSVKEVLNYTLMNDNLDGTYSQEAPYAVTNGEPGAKWDISLQIVSGAVEKTDTLTCETTTSYMYKECAANTVKLPVNNVIKDKDNKYPTLHDFTTYAIPASEKGKANGVAPLDGNKKIPSEYLPTDIGTGGGSISLQQVEEIATTKASSASQNALNEANAYTDGEIDKVNDALEDYSKTTDMQSYVEEKIKGITYPDIVQVVASLPTTDIQRNTLYLVTKSSPGNQDLYDEYVYTGSGWEYLGTRQATVDLTNYATKDDLEDYVKESDLTGNGNDDSGYASKQWVNNKGYATQSYVQTEIGRLNQGGGGSDGSGETVKELRLVNIDEMISTNNIDTFTELSKEYARGNISIIVQLGNVYGVVSAASVNEGEDGKVTSAAWSVVSSTWMIGEEVDDTTGIQYMDASRIEVFGIQYDGKTLSVGRSSYSLLDNPASKEDITQALSKFELITIVNALPEEPKEGTENKLYLVPKQGDSGTETDEFDEYAWIKDGDEYRWENVGSISLDASLTDYVKKTDIATSTTAGVVKVNKVNGIGLTKDNVLLIDTASNDEILDQDQMNAPIKPHQLPIAVKSALINHTGVSLSYEEKQKALAWIGAADPQAVGTVEAQIVTLNAIIDEFKSKLKTEEWTFKDANNNEYSKQVVLYDEEGSELLKLYKHTIGVSLDGSEYSEILTKLVFILHTDVKQRYPFNDGGETRYRINPMITETAVSIYFANHNETSMAKVRQIQLTGSGAEMEAFISLGSPPQSVYFDGYADDDNYTVEEF